MEHISKYYAKMHTEIVYNLEEKQCPHCKHWFMLDTDFCKNVPAIDYDDYYMIYCPYCGGNWRTAI